MYLLRAGKHNVLLCIPNMQGYMERHASPIIHEQQDIQRDTQHEGANMIVAELDVSNASYLY